LDRTGLKAFAIPDRPRSDWPKAPRPPVNPDGLGSVRILCQPKSFHITVNKEQCPRHPRAVVNCDIVIVINMKSLRVDSNEVF
jgi:hypothetical protein